MSRRAFVYCSDLSNYQVFGTFLELVSELKSRDELEVVPLVIAGERDASRLSMVDQFIQNELGVKSGYYQSVSNCELSDRKSVV